MSWLPKRDNLDPVQASAVDFAVAQEGENKVEVEMLWTVRDKAEGMRS